MGRKNRLIPFNLLPGAIGLKGLTRARAELEYYYEGEELERKLVELETEGDPKERARRMLKIDQKYNGMDGYDFELAMLAIDEDKHSDAYQLRRNDIDLKYRVISEYEHQRKKIELTIPEGRDRSIALLEVDLRFGKISQTVHDREIATLRNEPYIGVLNSNYDPNLNVNGLYFHLDWNDQFIDLLQQHGYSGLTQEQIVDQWFDDLCKSIAESAEEEDEANNRLGTSIQQVRREDGKTEYS